MTDQVAAVVPTVQGGERLARALRSLRASTEPVRVTVVHQGPEPLDASLRPLYDHGIEVPDRLGFSAANNLGLAANRDVPYWVLLNDDAEVEPDWLALCLEQLAAAPEAAGVQGVNWLARPGSAERSRIDGYGIGWNLRGWQARQLGRDRDTAPGHEPFELFGVSATACLVRRQALEAAALPDGSLLDPRLDTYYEDVDLAVRLRARGWSAICQPQAWARHLGGGSAASLGRRRLTFLYGNRYLVVARLLGRDFGAARAAMWRRDLRDLARSPLRLPGIVGGWRRARRLLPQFRHSGPPVLSTSELARFGGTP